MEHKAHFSLRQLGWAEMLLASLVAAFTAFWWRSAGTGDTLLYIKTMKLFASTSLVDGYRLTIEDVQYPPLSTAVLYLATRLDNGWLDYLAVLKLVLVAFQATAASLIYRTTRSLRQTLFFLLATTVSTVGLAYLDILMAPLIIAAMYLCQKKSYNWASLAFLAALLMKWQPLILLPGIVAFAVVTFRPSRVDWRAPLTSALLGLAICAALRWFFGNPFVYSLKAGIAQHSFLLSGDAANPLFLLTEILTTNAGRPGRLATNADFPQLWPWVNYIFDFAAIFAFSIYMRAKKSVENLLIFSVMIFWIYYLVSAGVHENHLAVAVFIAFMLPAAELAHRWVIGLTALAFNLNLVVFYFPPLIPNPPDLSVWFVLAIRAATCAVNTCVGISAIALCYRILRHASATDWEGVLVTRQI